MQILDAQAYLHSPDFPLGVLVDDSAAPDYPLHRHQFTELVVVAAGTGTHLTPEERYPLAPGDVFVIAPGAAHGYRDRRGLTIVNVLFDLERLPLPALDLLQIPGYRALFQLEPHYRRTHHFRSRLQLDRATLATVCDTLAMMRRELQQRPAGYRARCTGRLLELLVVLARQYHAMPGGDTQRLVQLARAIGYVESHVTLPITLAEVAAAAELTPRTLLRAFRRATGRSPLDHQAHLRLARARELLATTRLPVTDIAFRLGYGDSNYFARLFRRRQGCTPTAWRRAHAARPAGQGLGAVLGSR
jgi:AraC-like DNA-binding protein